jgi:outer membrane immunogenic protein
MLVAAAIGAQVAPAAADGMPTRAPDPYIYTPAGDAPLIYDWTGFYVGGALGAATSRMEWSALGITDLDRVSGTGFVGGGFVGLQKQWSWLVLGAEVEYLWAGQSGSSNSGTFTNTTFAANVHDLLLVTGKFGWNWENILAYFKGGWASGDVTYRTGLTIPATVVTSAGGRENGWTAGVGLEYALWPHVIIGVEYDYVAPFSASAQTQVISAFGPVGTSLSSHADTQSVTARLSFKFGGGS